MQSGIMNQNVMIPHQSGMISHQNGMMAHQSGMVTQQSQYMKEGNLIFKNLGSKIMQGSIMPPTQFSNIHNANIAQSNYIPNYQFKK